MKGVRILHGNKGMEFRGRCSWPSLDRVYLSWASVTTMRLYFLSDLRAYPLLVDLAVFTYFCVCIMFDSRIASHRRLQSPYVVSKIGWIWKTPNPPNPAEGRQWIASTLRGVCFFTAWCTKHICDIRNKCMPFRCYRHTVWSYLRTLCNIYVSLTSLIWHGPLKYK